MVEKNSLAGNKIMRDNSLGPFPLSALFCEIHDDLFTPAYPARANDPRKSGFTGSVAPTLFRAAIAGDMVFEPSS